MELLQLRYFATAARMQNISHAAAYHQIPQPAMSKTISKLEKELGTALFLRQRNRIYLTDQGQRFYERVCLSLQELDVALAELQQAQSSRQLHLHLLVTALRGKTAEVLSAFRRSHPNVTFQVTSTLEYREDHREYDLCISDKPPAAAYDCSIPLVQRQVDLYAAMARTNPLSHRQSLTLTELKEVPVVQISTSPLQQSVEELCRGAGFHPNVVISCDDLQCLQRYVRAGSGIAFTAPYSWPDMGDPNIQFVKVEAQLRQQISIYWNSKRPRAPEWMELVDQLQQYFNPKAPFWFQEQEQMKDRA